MQQEQYIILKIKDTSKHTHTLPIRGSQLWQQQQQDVGEGIWFEIFPPAAGAGRFLPPPRLMTTGGAAIVRTGRVEILPALIDLVRMVRR
jgi:hypothetical protein